MREIRTSGSVGGWGRQRPRPTRYQASSDAPGGASEIAVARTGSRAPWLGTRRSARVLLLGWREHAVKAPRIPSVSRRLVKNAG